MKEIKWWAGGAAMLAAATVVALYETGTLVAQAEHRVGKEENAPRQQTSKRQEPGARAAASDGAQPGAAIVGAGEARIEGQSAVGKQLEEVTLKLQSVQRERESLQREKRALETELRDLENDAAERDRYAYDPSPEQWKELAARGRVKYRMPCLMPQESAWKVAPAELDKLGLSLEDGETLGEAHARSNARVWSVLRPLCVDIVHDPDVVALLGPTNCLTLIEKVSSRSDLAATQEARRQVAEVHAGTRAAPAPGEPQHPLFESLLAVSSEGRRFEADLAESFGPEEAQRIWRSMSCAATRD